MPAYAAMQMNSTSPIPGDGVYRSLTGFFLDTNRRDFLLDDGINLMVPTMGLYLLNAEVYWAGGYIVTNAWQSARFRFTGPSVDGFAGLVKSPQIQDPREANYQISTAIQFLTAGTRVRVEVAHRNAYGQYVNCWMKALLLQEIDLIHIDPGV